MIEVFPSSRFASVAFALCTLLPLAALQAQTYDLREYLPYGPGDESVLTSSIGFDLVFTGGGDSSLTWDAADGIQEGLRQTLQWGESGLALLAEYGVLPDGSLAYSEDYTPPMVIAPDMCDAGAEIMNSGIYSGVEGLDTWTGTAQSKFTVVGEETVYVLPGEFTALRVQWVTDWEETGTGFTAHGTQTLILWLVKEYGVARMNFQSGETYTETGKPPEGDFVSINFTLQSSNLIPIVDIPDSGLEAAIRSALVKPSGDLTKPDLERLTLLNAYDRGISNLTGLDGAINLTHLTLSLNEIEDLSVLASMPQLQSLHIDRNRIQDLSPLSGLTNLTFLNVWTNLVSDVTPLAGLIHLGRLDLRSNSVADITPLATLEALTHVQLQANLLDLAEGSPNAAILTAWTKPGATVLSGNQYMPAPSEAGFRIEVFEGKPRFAYKSVNGGLYRIVRSPELSGWIGPYEFIIGSGGTLTHAFPLLEESEDEGMYYMLMVSFL